MTNLEKITCGVAILMNSDETTIDPAGNTVPLMKIKTCVLPAGHNGDHDLQFVEDE